MIQDDNLNNQVNLLLNCMTEGVQSAFILNSLCALSKNLDKYIDLLNPIMRAATTSTYINLAKLFIHQDQSISLRNLANENRMCHEICCQHLHSLLKKSFTSDYLSRLLGSIRNQKIAHNDSTATPGLIVNVWQLVDLSLCAYYFLDEYSTIAFNKHIAMPDTNLGPYLVESLAILDTDENVRQKCHDWCNDIIIISFNFVLG